jgi:hypothetical protein
VMRHSGVVVYSDRGPPGSNFSRADERQPDDLE